MHMMAMRDQTIMLQSTHDNAGGDINFIGN